MSLLSFPVFDRKAVAENLNLEGHSPIDLGKDFYAHIKHKASGLYITDKNSNVCASQGVFDKTQTWHFMRQDNGAYIMATDVSSHVMDVAGANFSDGTNVQMYQNNGGASQQFFLYYIEGNFYFKSVGDRTLDVDATTKNVQIYGCETGISSKETASFIFDARSFEVYKIQLDLSAWNSSFGNSFTGYIRNVHSNLLMTAEGDNVVFRGATYGNEQKWEITRNEYGGHIIKSVSTGKVLDVAAASLDHGADINLYSPNGSKAQTFFFIDTGGSRVYIKPSYTNTVVDMDANNHELHSCNFAQNPDNIQAQVFEIITEMHISDGKTVKNPVYLGNNFTANVILSSNGEYLTDNAGSVAMKKKMDTPSQIWTFQYDSEWKAYTIIGASGKVLDVTGGGYTSGASIGMYRANGTPPQKFRFYEYGSGYLISPAHTQKVVDVKSEDGTSLQLFDTTPSSSRLFSLSILTYEGQKPVNLGSRFESSIKNKASGLFVTGNNTGVLSCTAAESRWTFTRQANGSYVIGNSAFGKVLDVDGSNVNDGTNIKLYTTNGSLAQSFFIYRTDGGYVLRAANSGKCVDMDANTKQLHTYISSSGQTAKNAQTFVLEGIALKQSSKYVREDTYINKVPQKTSVSKVTEQFENTDLVIYGIDGNEIGAEEFCTTGSVVKVISGGKAVNSVSVVVPGDVDGNGIVDSTDYLRVKTTFIGIYKLEGVYFAAGDVDGNAILNSTDYLRIKGAFLDMYDLYASNKADEYISEKQPVEKEKDMSIDNSPEDILNYLNNKKYLLKSASATTVVSRIDFATNIVLHSGFYSNFAYYYPAGAYSEFGRFTDNAKFAEIAVNQGYMLKPSGKTFHPNDGITYEEVIRGYLYVLGYREYADSKGYLKLAGNIGLTDNISRVKSLNDTVTYGEYAQIVYNALHLSIVQCIELEGEYYVTARDGLYIADAYIARTDAAAKTSRIFKLANSGWDIFTPPSYGGYKYGPSIIINEDGSIDLWAASHSGLPGEIDHGTYRTSYDGGKTWTADVSAVQPTAGSQDWNWSCDPGIVKIGDWYYAAYTSTIWHDGLDNDLYVGRSKTPDGPFVEKWNGSGWGFFPKPVVSYDGDKTKWGMGEGSFVVIGDTLYIYCTLTNEVDNQTLVYTAPANDANWPGKIKYEGVAYNRDGGEDSADVKYVDAYNSFISVSTAARFSEWCYINIRTSYDGKFFRNESSIKYKDAGSNLVISIHNMGISGDAQGHIDIFKQNYVSYSYHPNGADWGKWPTRFTPIVWYGTHLYDKPQAVVQHSNGLTVDQESAPNVGGTRALNQWNERIFRVQNPNDSMYFYIQHMDKTGYWEEIPAHEYSKVVFYYDSSVVSIDVANKRVKLLQPKVSVVRYTYANKSGYFTVLPDYAYKDGPEGFFAEFPVVKFTKKGEVKQPGFVAYSTAGDHLVLWGNSSSYTTANTKDQPEYIRNWQQSVSLSGWDSRIINVDTNTGKITAKAVGETTVTATYMGKTATLKVIVEVV